MKVRTVEAGDLDAVRTALTSALGQGGPTLLALPDEPVLRRQTIEALRPDEPLEYDDIALVVPTSGSTGDPKLAMLPAQALLHSANATLDRLGGPGRWLLALPLTHIAGLQVVVRSIVADTPVTTVDEGLWPRAFITGTRQLPLGRRYTALVPTQLKRLLDAGAAAVGALAAYDAVLVGGAAASSSVLSRARNAGVNVVMTYGMSETCGGCVYDGSPLDGVRVAISGDGLVRLAGPVLAAGYRLRPDLTDAAFVDGWFGSADLGRLDREGRLRILGRADDVIVTGGVKVSAVEVADLLCAHPLVAEAAVVGRPDEEWGERVVAVVVPTDPAKPPALEDLRDLVSADVPRSHAPRELVVLDGMPRLPNGKVDRQWLRNVPRS